MTASAEPRSRPPSSSSRRSRSIGSSARRSAIVRFRIRSTSANSSGPACSAMTWPSKRPEQPDLDRERVAGAGRPDPERLGGDRRRDAAAP